MSLGRGRRWGERPCASPCLPPFQGVSLANPLAVPQPDLEVPHRQALAGWKTDAELDMPVLARALAKGPSRNRKRPLTRGALGGTRIPNLRIRRLFRERW